MSGWRKVAEELRQEGGAGHNRHDRHKTPDIGPNVPIVPIVPIVLANPARCVRDWHGELAWLDVGTPLHGHGRLRWREMLDDAHWLLDHFGNQAAREGWSAFDLFGVMPGRDAWGGIADRLRSSRSLVMSADVAKWRRVINGEPESFPRGLGETVRMVPIWEASE